MKPKQEVDPNARPKDEHARLEWMYGDKGVRRAPLSRKQERLIKRKGEEKVVPAREGTRKKLAEVDKQLDEKLHLERRAYTREAKWRNK